MTKHHIVTILILGALSTVGPFSIDMYLPGFPAIAKDLDTSIDRVQLSLTSYLIGIAVGQLLYGPLLDRFGRKNPLYAGLLIYVAASAICAVTTSINALIAMRLLQALGGCVGMVAAQTLVRDLFPLHKTAQVFSSLSLVIAVSPMVAPTAGGYITATYGWHYVFVLLALLTLLILAAVYFVLPEGRRPDPTLSLVPRAVLHNFRAVIGQKQFLLYAIVGGIATSAPFAYIAGSADVFMNLYGFTEQQYGWLFAFMAFGMIGTTQLNHGLLKKFTSQQLIFFALVYQCVFGVALIAGTWQGWFGPLTLIALMFIFLTGQGLTNPNAMALSLAPFRKLTGSAASLNGFVRMTMGGIVSAAVSIFHNNTPLPMIVVMVMCVMIGMIIYGSARKRVQHKPMINSVEEESAITI